MKLKYISKLLASSILISNLNILSFASSWSEDGRYETFEESNITIDNVLEEDTVDTEIEGNTLVNLIDSSTISEIDLDTKILSATTPTESHFILPYNSDLLIDGRQYTIIVNVVENEIDEEKFEVSSYYHGFKETIKIPANYTGVFKAVVTRDSATNNGRIGKPSFYVGQHTKSQTIRIKDFMILEGDWTGKEIPEYFEGIQSSFEEQLITQDMVNSGQERSENLGKYKVELKSAGKNILNANNNTVSKWTGDAKNHLITSIKLQVGKTYTFSHFNEEDIDKSYRINIAAFNNGEFVKNIAQIGGDYAGITKTATFTLNESYDEYYLEAHVLYDNISMSLKVQLEEGSSMTEYEPYKESVKAFYLNEPLRGLPNGIKDRIIKRNGAWYIERNYTEVFFDGDENWDMRYGPVEGDTKYGYHVELLEKSSNFNDTDIKAMSNNLPYDNSSYYSNLWSIKIDSSGTNLIIRTDLATDSVGKLREYLRENPLKVVYVLQTPVYEPLNIDSSIQLFKGTTYISNNSNIPTNMKVVVDRVANRALEAIERVKSEPSIENISQARYWSNLMKETLLKDDFQNELNNVTNSEDLSMEKKTVSANSDIYIKMKNSLSLSLDTNSIIFDDVDGTEGAELKSAVNLTVSSSLPYKINASLESEIYNSDKSNKLDKSTLNIKPSKESIYKGFADISTPITLLDDQSAGVDTIHSIDMKLDSINIKKADVYKTSVKFEVEQK